MAPVRGLLAIKPADFASAYNRTAVSLNIDQRAELRGCSNTGTEDTCQYKLTEYAHALVAGKLGGTTSTTILIIAGGENGAMAALGFMNTMLVVIATVNPELVPRERGELFKRLTKTDAKDHMDGEARAGVVRYSLKTVPGAGIWLTVNHDPADLSSDQLPAMFRGSWRGPDGAAIAIGPRSYTRPNSDCAFVSIKSSGLATGSGHG